MFNWDEVNIDQHHNYFTRKSRKHEVPVVISMAIPIDLSTVKLIAAVLRFVLHHLPVHQNPVKSH
jgi:hypothetical protein